MSNDKGSLEYGDHAPKFSIADDISEVYGLPGIHESVIDIDASQEDMEITDVKMQEVFFRICIFFIRAFKCSYHILYALALFIDHHELKAFTELVYTITGQKFGKFINRKLPGQNFNLHLIGLAKKIMAEKLDHVRIQPPLNLGLKGLDYRKKRRDEGKLHLFQPESSKTFIVKCFRQESDEPEEVFKCDPSIAEKIQKENKNISLTSYRIKGLGFSKAFIKMPSWVKYNETLTATEIYEERYVRPLLNESDIYVISSWETKKTYVLKHLTISDDMNLLVLSTRHSYLNAVITRLNFKSYYNINETVLAELWDWAKKMTSLPIENWKSASLICYLRKDVQGIVRAFKTNFSELQIKKYHDKS
ncbi:19043_t:CDS:2 [Funneliformis geosporum]|uniref:19043_t:CDS:1 n=1 Tax=Funneliformis geosporum TaxID=1117311 RepID=A0A9W4SN52_9GLOM|nr:19043_t:CDS:2 [Funneliformis geosporum]